jgi:hypothetical protein
MRWSYGSGARFAALRGKRRRRACLGRMANRQNNCR